MRDVLENLKKLPPTCLVIVEGQVMVIKRGAGMSPTPWPKDQVDSHNQRQGVSPQQAQAMLVGATLGWDHDGADPDTHAEALGEQPGPFSYEYMGSITLKVDVVAHTEEMARRQARSWLEAVIDLLQDSPAMPAQVHTFALDDTIDLIDTDDPQ